MVTSKPKKVTVLRNKSGLGERHYIVRFWRLELENCKNAIRFHPIVVIFGIYIGNLMVLNVVSLFSLKNSQKICSTFVMGVWTKCEQFMRGRHYIVRFCICVSKKKKLAFFFLFFLLFSLNLVICRWQESYSHIGIGYVILG